MEAARGNPELRASSNHGRPPIAATERPGAFSGNQAVPTKEGGHYDRPPQGRNSGGQPQKAIHANELSAHQRSSSPNTGDPNRDKQYQQQQEKLYAKQQQDHVKLQQKQEQDHRHLEHQQANDARMQQVERQHQQQTQQMAPETRAAATAPAATTTAAAAAPTAAPAAGLTPGVAQGKAVTGES